MAATPVARPPMRSGLTLSTENRAPKFRTNSTGNCLRVGSLRSGSLRSVGVGITVSPGTGGSAPAAHVTPSHITTPTSRTLTRAYFLVMNSSRGRTRLTATQVTASTGGTPSSIAANSASRCSELASVFALARGGSPANDQPAARRRPGPRSETNFSTASEAMESIITLALRERKTRRR